MNLKPVQPAYSSFFTAEEQYNQHMQRIAKMRSTLSDKKEALIEAENKYRILNKEHQKLKLDALVGEADEISSDELKQQQCYVNDVQDDIALLENGLEEAHPREVYLKKELDLAKQHFIRELEKSTLESFENDLSKFCAKSLKTMMLMNQLASHYGVTLARPEWNKKKLNLLPAGEFGWLLHTGALTPVIADGELESWRNQLLSALQPGQQDSKRGEK